VREAEVLKRDVNTVQILLISSGWKSSTYEGLVGRNHRLPSGDRSQGGIGYFLVHERYCGEVWEVEVVLNGRLNVGYTFTSS
jgi:hypothetical protein